jgi:trehalose 6-phosphate phosphatase
MADLAGLAARAAQAGIFCDFDGALAPIVGDPAESRPLPGAGRLMAALARRFRVVAIVSGRAARDVASRVRAPGVRIVGLHGMETMVGERMYVIPAASAAAERVNEAAIKLRVALRGIRGAVLEHKGLAIAVHFRRAADPVEAERLAAPIVIAAAADYHLEVMPGRRILELKPPGGGDKGSAVRAMIDEYGLRAALFAGDDVGDEPAFAALDALPLAVRVAVASDESPPGLLDRADLVVASPAELLALLRRLV